MLEPSNTAMDITNILNNKGSAAGVAAEHHLPPNLVRVVRSNDRPLSENGSEIETSSEQSSGYSARSTQPIQSMPHLPNDVRFPSPSQMEQPMPMLASGYSGQSIGLGSEYEQAQYPEEQEGLLSGRPAVPRR